MPVKRYLIIGIFIGWAFQSEHTLSVPPATTQVAQGVKVTAFDPRFGRRIACDGKWVAWTRVAPNLDPKVNKGAHGGPSQLVQYYVQRLDDDAPPTELLRGGEPQSRPEKHAVLDDGSLISGGGGWLYWMMNPPPENPRLVHHDNESGQFIVFSGGVIHSAGQPGSRFLNCLWWIPVKKDRLDYDSKVVIEKDMPQAGMGLSYIRHQNNIVWVDDLADTDNPARPHFLFNFDISKGSVTKLQVSKKESWIEWFDGVYCLMGPDAFDITTGQQKRIPKVGEIVGMEKGVIYYTEETSKSYQLLAVPVDGGKQSWIICEVSKELIGPAPRKDQLPENFRLYPGNLFLVSEDSIRAWNGRTWAEVSPRPAP